MKTHSYITNRNSDILLEGTLNVLHVVVHRRHSDDGDYGGDRTGTRELVE